TRRLKRPALLPDGRLWLNVFHHRRANWLAFFDQFDLSMRGEPGAGWNQVTHDYVSLKPRNLSTLPNVAASVRTRVVSWNEAAEMKLSVSSDAFVIPSKTGTASAGLPPFSTTFLFSSSKSSLST